MQIYTGQILALIEGMNNTGFMPVNVKWENAEVSKDVILSSGTNEVHAAQVLHTVMCEIYGPTKAIPHSEFTIHRETAKVFDVRTGWGENYQTRYTLYVGERSNPDLILELVQDYIEMKWAIAGYKNLWIGFQHGLDQYRTTNYYAWSGQDFVRDILAGRGFWGLFYFSEHSDLLRQVLKMNKALGRNLTRNEIDKLSRKARFVHKEKPNMVRLLADEKRIKKDQYVKLGPITI